VYERLETAAREGLEQVDVLILSAGSSVSTRDMTAQVIASLGEPGVLVHGVSLKPGKPTILAVVGDKPVFGLPGNPVSCMVTFDLFVAPTLHRLTGARGAPLPVGMEEQGRALATAGPVQLPVPDLGDGSGQPANVSHVVPPGLGT